METESALYRLMDVRMNGVMNGITNIDKDYQEIIPSPTCSSYVIFLNKDGFLSIKYYFFSG